MSESIFRKKSLDKISSPEEIDQYMRVTSPSLWLVFGAILVLLAAILIWSVTGQIESTVLVNGQPVTEVIAPIELLLG